MAEYEKNRSTRRSTPRHPIAMASTTKPPDPMPCALAAILLPESRARTAAICKKACFRGPTGCMPGRVRSDSSCVRGARVRRGCAAGAWAASWVRGGGAWRRGWEAYVGREPLTVAREHVGVVRAVAWGSGRLGVFPQCGVEHAWALGLLRRPVTLSGLLLRWPSRAFCCCCVGER